jgi:hypothetical protein
MSVFSDKAQIVDYPLDDRQGEEALLQLWKM